MKNNILILIYCFIVNSAFGQDSIYLNDNYEEIKSFNEATYYKTIEELDANNILEKIYQVSGQIQFETVFELAENDKKIYNGSHKVWYETGELRFEAWYQSGKKNGEFLSYWKNGALKRKDFYKNGKLKEGTCWNENGETVKYYAYEIPPKYPGGILKMQEFIAKNLKYPPVSKQYNLGGKVVVEFKIDTDGNVSDVKIIESVNDELDNEAIRIIKSMPKWSTGYHDGIAVSVKYTIPLNFKP